MAGWGLNKDFQEVPSQLLRRDMWTPRLWGRWKHESGILELEARALVMSLRRIALSIFGHDTRQLLLTDNMSVCLSFDRSRAKNYPLLKQIRIFNAYCLARNISCTIRWVPSELNSADEPSRLDSSEVSKTLVHAIPTVVQSPKGSLFETTPREEEVGGSQKAVPIGAARGKLIKGREDPTTQESVCRKGLGNSQDPRSVQPDGCHPGCNNDLSEKTKGVIRGLNQFHPERQEEERESLGFGTAHIQEVEASGGPDNGEGRHDPFGVPSHQTSDGTSVSDAVERLHGLRAVQAGELRGRHRGGQSLGGSHECPVFVGAAELPSRSPPSGFPSHLSPVWEEWTPEVAPLLACHQRVPEVDTWKEPKGTAISSLGSLCSGDEEERFSENGRVPPACRINLCEALGIVESPGLLVGAASSRCNQGVVHVVKPRRGRRNNQDWRVRHQCNVGLPMDGQLDESHLRAFEEKSSRKSSMGFRLPCLQQDLPRHCQVLQCGCHALPDKAQWSKHRQVQAIPKSTRSSKTWPVESPEKHHEIRKSGKVGKHVGSSTPEVQGSRPRVRGKPWGDLAGPKTRTNLQRRRCIENRYIMDLFSGEGGVAKACTEMGFRAKEWDIKHGVQHDLTKPAVVKRLISEAKRGRVLACMMAPVCTSFSVARDRTKVIRNRQYPWGIPFHLLTEKERQSIILGNKCFRTCLKLMKVFDQLHIPYILKNPATSKAWFLPEMILHSQQSHIKMIRADFCQFNTPWKKPTLFMCANVDPIELHRLSKTCSGPRGQCSRTKAPHFLLSGSRRDGRPWTQIAQPYPRRLCVSLAHILTSSSHLNSAQNFF